MRQAAVMFDQLGQAKVRHVRAPFSIHQNVAGLEVTVQDATLMRVMNRASNRGEQTGGFALCVAADVKRIRAPKRGMRPTNGAGTARPRAQFSHPYSKWGRAVPTPFVGRLAIDFRFPLSA